LQDKKVSRIGPAIFIQLSYELVDLRCWVLAFGIALIGLDELETG
jgi:hypothetical protein